MRKRIEAREQEYFFNWLSLSCPKLRGLCFAIPNGGSRNLIEAKGLKRQGVTAGVPDIFCAIQSNGYPGLFIELKYGKNKLTSAQGKMKELLEQEGYKHVVCYGWNEAKDIFLEYIDVARRR